MPKLLKNLMLIGGAVMAFGLVSQAQAQYTGPGHTMGKTTVAQILKNPVDDQEVILRGHITKKIRKEHYEFTDNTGTIRMEIDDKYFYNVQVTDKTLVEIHGEVETELMRAPEVDVEKLIVIQP